VERRGLTVPEQRSRRRHAGMCFTVPRVRDGSWYSHPIVSRSPNRRLWHQTICSLIVLLFAGQIALPMATSPACTMQCCRRAHGKKSCDHSSRQSSGPSFTESGGCGGDCTAVAPAFSPLAVRFRSAGFAIQVKGSPSPIAESFGHIAALASSNSFQRPPPLL
jgi:hypothetical protein